jgi:hypothetical protein
VSWRDTPRKIDRAEFTAVIPLYIVGDENALLIPGLE